MNGRCGCDGYEWIPRAQPTDASYLFDANGNPTTSVSCRSLKRKENEERRKRFQEDTTS